MKSIIEELRSVSGTNDKKEILKKYKDNKEWLQLIEAINPIITYNIQQLPSYNPNIESLTLSELITGTLEELRLRKVTGHKARDLLQDSANKLSSDNYEILCLILGKDLECGVASKTYNSIYKGIHSEPGYMRCTAYDRDSIKRYYDPNGNFIPSYLDVKEDGQYRNTMINSDTVSYESRQGHYSDFLGSLDEDHIKVGKYLKDNYPNYFSNGVVLTGELLSLDQNGNRTERATTNGIVGKFKTGKVTGSKEESETIINVVWDLIPIEDFQKGVWKVPFKERRKMLKEALESLELTKIQLVKSVMVYSEEEVIAMNRNNMANKLEGSVLKHPDGIWKSHTSPNQLKMKNIMSIDLRVVGFEEGTGKFKGSLGSVKCESECGKVKVKLSGFKENYTNKDGSTNDSKIVRDYIWNNKNEFLDSIVELKCEGLTQNKNTKVYSISLPRFEEWRFDKDTADTLERIKQIENSSRGIIESLEKDDLFKGLYER